MSRFDQGIPCCDVCPFLKMLSLELLFLFSCSRWSFVDVLLVIPCPGDYVPDWQPDILLGMVEA